MRSGESQSGTDERTVAVTRARVRRWMLTADSVRVATLAVSGGRAGPKQGFAGSSGHKYAGQELVAQSCRTRTLAIVVGGEGDWKAQRRDGGSEGLHWWRWSRLRQRKMAQGFAGRGGGGGGGGGGNVKWPFGHPPGLYKHPTAAEGSFPPNFSF